MRWLAGLAAILFAPTLVLAQAVEVSAPFVSRLRAQVEGSAVVLTWQDSTDALGPVTIYRHTEEISADNFARARRVADVPYGKGSFRDQPSDTQAYFYALISHDVGGRPFEVFVAFRNKTVSPRAIDEVGTPEEVGARVEGISVHTTATRVRVAFASDRPARTLVLYRSTNPIARVADLVGTVAVILEPGSTSYDDDPPAGIAFYYAVVDEELAKVGRARFVAGVNATVAPAVLPIQAGGPAAAPAATTRSRPLPLLSLGKTIYSGEDVPPAQEMPPRVELAPATVEAVTALVSSLPREKSAPAAVTVLDIDRGVTGGGEESILQSIVAEALETGDKAAAEDRLRSFLSIRRGAELDARARFYLGQALYLQGRKSEALAELLFARDVYYAEARPWVDRCLDELAGVR
jgi:hypothetical protein